MTAASSPAPTRLRPMIRTWWHACGWRIVCRCCWRARGGEAGVVAAAVAALRERINGQKIFAAIGPSIGPANFEVGMEVVEEFRRLFGSAAPAQIKCGGKAHVDLRAGIAMQLRACRIDADHITRTDHCTFRDADEF